MTAEEFNISVDKYSDNIYRFILKNINNEDKAKDIIQDTFEKLWIKHKSVSFNKVKSYLFTAAYHTMIDNIRKNKRLTGFDSENMPEIVYENEYTDIQEILHRLINKLPDMQRSVLLLRDYEGYSYQEIEEITGLNESQVKVYIYRARVFLKNYIKNIETIL